MKTIHYKILTLFAIVFLLGTYSCTEDLNTVPIDEDVVTSASVYDEAEGYRQVLAKCYAGLSMTGQEGPAGNPDIQGIDEGFSSYLREIWYHQVLTTDEAIIAWNDAGLPDFWQMNWSATNGFVRAMYNRIFYQITLCNEFIRESNESALSERGFSEAEKQEIGFYRAEARFLRAFSYWHALDMFGNVPFITEDDNVGAFFPEQINRADLFDYIEQELLDLVDNLKEPKQNEYGRIDKAAAWMLLAKLYLNAEVYTGTERYSDALDYSEQVINSAYSLDPNYEELFLADNHTANGIIFPVTFDGENAKTYGGMNFVIHAAVGGSMNATDTFGIDGGWGGSRATPELYNKFSVAGDKRSMFHTDGQSIEITDPYEFTNGYAVTKFKNVTSTGQPGPIPAFADTDWPVFRLADAYLMYAEAAVRTGTNQGTAVGYVNDIRQRAFGDNTGDITQADLTLDFILNERARELYWEGHRRTDLIRFGRFVGSNYLWAWKGNVEDGRGVDAKFKLFPIPASDINANPNLTQNDDY